jgi:hypothetical protein
LSHDSGSGSADILTFALVCVKLLVDGSSRLHQLADDMTLRWKLFAAVLTNSKHWYTGSFFYYSEATFRHVASFPLTRLLRYPVGNQTAPLPESHCYCRRRGLLLRSPFRISPSPLPGTCVLPDGPFAQPIEMMVHSPRPTD